MKRSRSGERKGRFCPVHGEQGGARSNCSVCGGILGVFDPATEAIEVGVVPDFDEEMPRGPVYYRTPIEKEEAADLEEDRFQLWVTDKVTRLAAWTRGLFTRRR